MEQVRNADAQPMDHLSYLTKTPDGKILKSSTMYIRGKGGKVVAILGINYDISSLLMVESAVRELTAAGDSTQTEPENDHQRQRRARRAHRPVRSRSWASPSALMNKEDKMRAIRFLNQQRRIPRHQVRRQGRQIFRHFQIYTLFLY